MNKYEVLGIVNEGAYGIVYKAKNKENGDVVAIKKFKETDEDDIVKKTTLREVKVLRMIKHPNVVQLKEAFKRKGRLFLVFEYCEKNLLEVIEDKPQGLSPEEIKRFIYELLKAIEFCHRHGVIHRDIKPENLLIDGTQDILKLCDFGFARTMTNKNKNKLTDYVATRWYRSPELLLGSSYGAPVDIWAIGCIMGEITDGDPLFPGDSEIDQLYQIQKIIGKLTPDQEEQFAKNPRFIGLKFPELKTPETLEKHYIGKMAKNAIDLMGGMLRMDPKARYSAIDALSHSYFDTVRDSEVEELIESHKEKLVKQVEDQQKRLKESNSRTKDHSKRRTSTEKSSSKTRTNPYSLPLGTSPPQFKKKKNTQKFHKEKKASNSIKNLRKGRSSSKDNHHRRNGPTNSYDSNAYPRNTRNKRNMPNNDSLRENQSMSNYIPSSFSGLYLNSTNTKNETTEYDYEIGGEFGQKGVMAASTLLDNSMGLPSQVYGTGDLKNSLSTSVSGILSKATLQAKDMRKDNSSRKIPSLSPTGRSDENKTSFKSYHSSLINKAMSQSKIRKLFENISNENSHLQSINETLPPRHDQSSSYYEEEKSQKSFRGNKSRKRGSLKTRENTERRAIQRFKQTQPKQSFKKKNESQMSIVEFSRGRMSGQNEYNYEIPDSQNTSQMKSEDYRHTGGQYPFL
ncbi:unnamed protein product [Moneuplotes crassus]|uniref:cyclin-dependent kinase n=2 Tax=Euplotes crassus TaxID=5936 RepID=A0AAD2DAN3_EUPCR|nr:unnamed protein product [Moneuplotes crassus]